MNQNTWRKLDKSPAKLAERESAETLRNTIFAEYETEAQEANRAVKRLFDKLSERVSDDYFGAFIASLPRNIPDYRREIHGIASDGVKDANATVCINLIERTYYTKWEGINE